MRRFMPILLSGIVVLLFLGLALYQPVNVISNWNQLCPTENTYFLTWNPIVPPGGEKWNPIVPPGGEKWNPIVPPGGEKWNPIVPPGGNRLI